MLYTEMYVRNYVCFCLSLKVILSIFLCSVSDPFIDCTEFCNMPQEYGYVLSCSLFLMKRVLYQFEVMTDWCSHFVMLSLNTLPSHSNILCLQLDLFSFCSNGLHSDILLLAQIPCTRDSTRALALSCSCLLAKPLLSDLYSALGIFM